MRARKLDELPGREQTGTEQLVQGIVGLPHRGAGLQGARLVGDRRVVQQLRKTAVGAPPHRQRVTPVRPGIRGRREVVGGWLFTEVEDHLATGGTTATAAV